MFAALNLSLPSVGLMSNKGENMKNNEEIYQDFRDEVAKLFGIRGNDENHN